MKGYLIVPVLIFAFVHHSVFAQDNYKPQRQELRQILQLIEDGINDEDASAIEPFVGSNTIIVFQDAVVTRGKEEFSTYFKRILGSTDSLISDMSVKAAIGAPAVFYGEDVAVAFGSLKSTYKLRAGKAIDLDTQWTTTVVRQEGAWSIASLHFSNNLFNNPILNASKQLNWMFAIAGLLLGLLLMWMFKWLAGGRNSRSVGS